jgi:uncharacterized membrane protein YdjX (TVP38/TMEM64 family)
MIDHIFASKQSRRKALIVLAFLIIGFALLLYLAKPLILLFKNDETLKEFVLSYGSLAPLVFIALQVVQVLLSPLPGQVTAFVAGYLFGWWQGTLYTMLGLVAGSLVAFFLARKFGRPFVEKVVDKPILEKFDYLSTHKGPFALFMLFLLPALPDDALCFIAGLSILPMRHFLAIALLGRLPGMLMLSLVGSGVAQQDATMVIILLSIILVASGFGWWYRKDIEDYYHNNTFSFENSKKKRNV